MLGAQDKIQPSLRRFNKQLIWYCREMLWLHSLLLSSGVRIVVGGGACAGAKRNVYTVRTNVNWSVYGRNKNEQAQQTDDEW